MIITMEQIDGYRQTLEYEEKSRHTIEKYVRDVRAFIDYVNEDQLNKDTVIGYKNHLIEVGYAVESINSMLAAVNSFLHFIGREDCRVKHVRAQRKVYNSEDKELSKEEYIRLLHAAEGNSRLYMILETICATGIRVSELKYFTVEEVVGGEVRVSCKNKTRIILLPARLRKKLMVYAGKQGIIRGFIFRTAGGRPVDRSNIWTMMKRLCKKANVNPAKVYPHNLRKLFARTFYKIEKDIARLADLLGHSNINTTRIYLMTTSAEHLRKIESLGLVL